MAALGYDVVSFSEACMDVNHVVYRIRCTELRVDRGMDLPARTACSPTIDVPSMAGVAGDQSAGLRLAYRASRCWYGTDTVAAG